MEAYGKYRNLNTNPASLSGFAMLLTGAFDLTPGMPGEAGMAYDALDAYGTLIEGGLDHSDDPDAPKAYLNIILFDKNHNFVDAAYKQLSGTAEQVGTSVKAPHDYLVREVTVTEPGYAYIFLSNENPTQVDVHFDDVTITHTHSNIVAGADYYPFGLAMETREITREDYRYGYQGQFSEKDLTTTGWNEFELRFYDAKIGRWLSADPYGQYHSPYVAMGNTPHMSVDANGGWSWITAGIGAALGAGVGYATTGDWKGALIGGLAGGAIGGLSFNQTRVGFDGGTRIAHSHLRISRSSFLAAYDYKSLAAPVGYYFRLENFDPAKPAGPLAPFIPTEFPNGGTFDNKRVEPDERIDFFGLLDGEDVIGPIGFSANRWYGNGYPKNSLRRSKHTISGHLEDTRFSITIRPVKDGILMKAVIHNSSVHWNFPSNQLYGQAVRIIASEDAVFNPMTDAIIGAKPASMSRTVQRIFLQGGVPRRTGLNSLRVY